MIRVGKLLALGLLVVACAPTAPVSPGVTPPSSASTAPSVGPSATAPSSTSIPSVTPTVLASPSPVPSPTPSLAPSIPTGWTEVIGPSALGGDQVLGVVRFSGGMLAYGQGDGHVAMWISPDGATWKRVPAQAVFDDPFLVVRDIAAGSHGLVAVGEADDRGAVLTSPDGLAWRRAPDQVSLRPKTGQAVRINAVTSTPSGFVAVGGTTLARGPAFQAIAPLSWTSSDGRHWKRGFPMAASGINLAAVTAAAGRLIALGGSYNPPLMAFAFRSTDGRHWSRQPDQPSFKGASIHDVAFAGGQFVAGGIEFLGGDGYPAVWISSDGRSWHYWRLSRRLGQVFHVAPVGDGFGVAGPSTETTGVWFTKDGRKWVGDKPGLDAPYEVAANDDVIVLVGLEGIWIKARP